MASSAPEPLVRALELAFRRLNRRESTSEEIRRHLLARDLDEETVAAAVSELVREGYVDDARYARLFAEDRRTLDGWGAKRIRRSLAERGVDRELIEAAIAGTGTEDESELHRAIAVLMRRFPSPPSERRERERAFGVLVRKGYDSELAADAIAAYVRGAAT